MASGAAYVAMFTTFKILFFFFYLCVPDKDVCAQHAEMHRLHCNVKYDAKLVASSEEEEKNGIAFTTVLSEGSGELV